MLLIASTSCPSRRSLQIGAARCSLYGKMSTLSASCSIESRRILRKFIFFSALTPAASDLIEIEVPNGHTAYVYTEDLNDFYPAFSGNLNRAATNAVNIGFDPEVFNGTRAYRMLQKRCSKLGVPLTRSSF